MQAKENRGWFSGIPRFFLLWLFNFNGPVNRALDDRQVFFGTKFQLVADPLALLTFRTQHFGIEIPFHRKPAGLDKLDHDREAGDRPFILTGRLGIVPLFSMLARYRHSIPTISASALRARRRAFRAAFTSAPKVSKPGQSSTFAI